MTLSLSLSFSLTLKSSNILIYTFLFPLHNTKTQTEKPILKALEMAETSPTTRPKHKHKPKKDQNKSHSNFIQKTLILAIFLIIIPLVPSQAPEFINQTLLNPTWELLHLVIVGLAISYGLFSRKNANETQKEKENNNKFDNANSYVSRFLEVSPVFDEETVNLSDENCKVETWSNRYYRNEPMVVLAKDHSVHEEQRVASHSRNSQKPLFLPVRSLKSRPITEDDDSCENREFSRDSSKGSSKMFSSNSRGRSDENYVLPSPIPWKSRSGVMDAKEETKNAMIEETMTFKPQVSPSLRSDSTKCLNSSSLSSPRKPSPLLSPSAESFEKKTEDFLEKNFYRSSPPPPPPPPPPMVANSSRMNQISDSTGKSPKYLNSSSSLSSPKKPSSPLPSPSTESFDKKTEDFLKKNFYRSCPPPPPPPPPPPMVPKSSRLNPVTDSTGNSVRTTKPNDSNTKFKKDRFFEDGFDESSKKECKFDFKINQTPYNNGKQSQCSFAVKQSFKEYPKEENRGFMDNIIMETDDDDDDDDSNSNSDGDYNNFKEIRKSEIDSQTKDTKHENEDEEKEIDSGNDSDEEGPDVDKKADEFIAKFREQIRLQRIESIKRSSAQISRRNS